MHPAENQAPPGAAALGGDAAPAAVLLAAGQGRRLGLGPKALLAYRGRALVQVLAGELLAAGCRPVVVVLGAGADDVGRRADLPGCTVVLNPDWAQGMAGSFRSGVAQAAAEAPGSSILVALVDQPGLSAGLIERLAQAHREHARQQDRAGFATAAAYAGADGALRRGHPVIFSPAAAAGAAAAATGDAGAKAWLAANADRVRLVECTDLDDGRDVDVPADLGLLG